MQKIIQVDHVSKKYGFHEAVSDITLSVARSQITAFLGPNGAGKSTTMAMLSTLLMPTSGKILVDSYSISQDREQLKRLTGIVFQENVLDSNLTVYENLFLRGSLYYASRHQVLEQIENVADMLCLNKLLSKRYRTCSGGQKRLCQIGRTLMGNPKLLLLDEPTAGLDPIAREVVWEALLMLNHKYKKTILFTTHYMEEADYATHICMMKQGHIMVCGEKQALLLEYGRKGCKTLQQIYMYLLREDYKV